MTSINTRVMVPNSYGERTLVLLLLYIPIPRGETNSCHYGRIEFERFNMYIQQLLTMDIGTLLKGSEFLVNIVIVGTDYTKKKKKKNQSE